jgi:tetratricopeptide (TPR) repeat protein
MSLAGKAIAELIRREDHVKAWFAVNQALNEAPEAPDLLYLAGCILRQQGHIGMALPMFAKALSKDQRQPNLWMHYAATLHDLNEWEDAIKAFLVVHKMIPTDPMPPANIASSCTQQGNWREAMQWAEKALKLDPENYIAHISASYAYLALGRWEEGWKHSEYLYGNHLVIRVYNDKENEEPDWDGSPGKTVVVQCDQGVGDILMYGQCLTDMVKDCKTVIIECAQRLVPLMKRNFPGVTVYGTLKESGQGWSLNHRIDAHIHISALPKFYRNKESDFPRVAYIKPDEKKVEYWKQWLSTLPKPWIGISWQGGIQNTQKHLRTLKLEQLEPVLSLEGSFIDLSYKDNSSEIDAWNARGISKITRPKIDRDDYDDTLALVAVLDEVVTVTTAVVHACGVMGRSARVLVPAVPMWRYAYRCNDDGMIWYPKNTLKMYRQVHGERWESTIKRLAEDIKPKILLEC